jgi:histidinol-phosphate aminotransferase
MSRVVSDRIRALDGYAPGEQPSTDARVIKLNTNENPYQASPKVARAVEESLSQLHLYPDPMSDRLRRAAASLYGVRPENILVGNGSDELLSLSFRACTPDGGRVAFPVPTYSLYRTLAEIAGCEVVTAPSLEGRVPPELIDADADIVFLCTPNSPLGYEITMSELENVAEHAAGLVVIDEAYVDFGGTTALRLVDRFDNVLVLRTLSKSFSLAGARVGLAFGEVDLIRELTKVKDSYNVSRLAQAAGQAALEDPDWMESNARRVVATRARVAAALGALGFFVRQSAGNFLWVECGASSGRAVYEGLRDRGILVRYFDAPPLSSGVRVSIGTDPDMDRFLTAIADVANRR